MKYFTKIPMEKEYKVKILEKFGNEVIVISRGNLHLKHESVNKFIKFIKDNIKQEEEFCPQSYQSHLLRLKKVQGKEITDIIQDVVEKSIYRMNYYGKKRKIKSITGFAVK